LTAEAAPPLLQRTWTAIVGRHPDEDEQREELRRLVVWFWHDLSHFATAFACGQWWWAYGELETLRAPALA